MQVYTGIGSRETPPEVLGVMEDAAFRLARCGFILRSGKAMGADGAFQLGVQKYQKILDNGGTDRYSREFLAEVYTPWSYFKTEGLSGQWDIPLSYLDQIYPEQIPAREALVEELHPSFQALKARQGAFLLHSRNVHQVLGADILNPRPSKFCLFFAREDKKGNPKGGTATAVKLAQKYGVRTLNLNTPERLATLESFITALEEHRGISL